MGKKRNSKTSGIRLEFKNNNETCVGNKAQQQPNSTSKSSNLNQSITSADGTKQKNETRIGVDSISPAEKLLLAAKDDEPSFVAFVSDWEKRQGGQKEIREKNLSPNYEEFEALINSKKLDSNLKKCTGFVRKMKQYVETQKEVLEKELGTLNLTKYLSEIADAIVEVRIKINDINDIVSICSLIHQKYSEFSSMLLENFRRVFPMKKSDLNSSVLSKFNLDLRLFGELFIQGILPLKESSQLLIDVFRALLPIDKDDIQCIVPVINFLRGVGKDITGLLQREIRLLCEQYKTELKVIEILSPDRKKLIKAILKDYCASAEKIRKKRHEKVIESEMCNRKFLKTRGEVPADKLAAHTELLSNFEKFNANVESFANLIDEDLPELKVLEPEQDDELAKLEAEIGVDESGELTVPGIIIFEDEDTRAFYQDFPNLKVYLPPVAYRENLLQAAEEEKAIAAREKESQNIDMDEEAALLQEEEKHEDEEVEELPPSMRVEEKEVEVIKPNFRSYLSSLLNCVNRNMIDKSALEFAENFNNKPNRKKLVRTLFLVPRQRIDLLPLFSRLVAILNPVMPDVGIELSNILKNDFRYLVRKKDQIFIETKLKITRFIGELVNFGIFPKSDAFTCFKMLLMVFVHHQVEMACAFVETCGRFLYKTPSSHRRMKLYMQEMMRKKTVKTLEPRYVSMIDHAYYVIFPPEGGAKKVRKRHVLDLFFRNFVTSITKANAAEKLRVLRTLKWEKPLILFYAIRCFSQPWEFNSNNFGHIISVLYGLGHYYSHIPIAVADNIIEDIRNGLDYTHTRNNHRRISAITYLGELYNYKLIGEITVFNVLYDLINMKSNLSENYNIGSDPPSTIFRVRLVCILLNISGDYFVHGSIKKKLILFLKYFQRYFWRKRESDYWKNKKFPYAIQEKYEDTLKFLFPKIKFASSLEEAENSIKKVEEPLEAKLKLRFKEAKKELKAKRAAAALQNLHTIDEGEEENEGKVEQQGYDWFNRSRRPSNSNNPWDFYEQQRMNGLTPAGQQYPSSDAEYEEDYAGDDDFIRAFDKMCTESAYRGKVMKTEIAIPLQIRTSSAFVSQPEKKEEEDSNEEKTVDFVLIQRKGNKQQFKNLLIPSETDFVKNMKSREEEAKAEKERMKKITLGINRLQMQEERDEELKRLQTQFFK